MTSKIFNTRLKSIPSNRALVIVSKIIQKIKETVGLRSQERATIIVGETLQVSIAA